MTQEKEKTQKIFAAMGKVMSEIGAIAKNRTAKMTKFSYNYRGIDDLLNHLHPLCAEHNIIILPRCLWHSYENQEGRTQPDHAIVKSEFDFISTEDGSRVTSGPFIGEGFDNGDKSFNCAQTAALKWCLFQTFLVPLEEMKSPGRMKDSEKNPENTTNPPARPPAKAPATKSAGSGNIQGDYKTQNASYIAPSTEAGTDYDPAKAALEDAFTEPPAEKAPEESKDDRHRVELHNIAAELSQGDQDQFTGYIRDWTTYTDRGGTVRYCTKASDKYPGSDDFILKGTGLNIALEKARKSKQAMQEAGHE